MKQIVCEMCGGKNLIKQDGVFGPMVTQLLPTSIFQMGLAGITKQRET